MNVIETCDLKRRYDKKEVLSGIDLEVRRGSIYAFLGRNGAGKTTFIRALAGLLSPSEGTVRVLGEDPSLGKRSLLERIGYVADANILPQRLKLRDLIAWTSALYSRWSREIERRLVKAFDLDPSLRVSQLSLGQSRQLAFILAAAARPEVLILDEPGANLDTVARRTYLSEVAALARELETTVFFSSHVLTDVERIADHVGILAGGRLVVNDALDEVKETFRKVRFFWDRENSPPVELESAFGVTRGRGEVTVTIRCGASAAALAMAAGCRHEERALNLEDLFVEVTGGEKA